MRRLVAVVLAALMVPGALAVTEEQRILDLAYMLRCPECRSVSVAESPAEIAGGMYASIVAQVRAGRSDQEIIDFFVARYGEGVLLRPPAQGLNLMIWIGPALVVLVGGVLVFRLLRGWTTGNGQEGLRLEEVDPEVLARVRRETRAEES